MIRDPDMMPKSPKRKGIRIRCWRAIEKLGDPDTMSESHLKDKRSKLDVGEPSKR